MVKRSNIITSIFLKLGIPIIGISTILILVLLQMNLIVVPELGNKAEVVSVFSILLGSLIAIFVFRYSKLLSQKTNRQRSQIQENLEDNSPVNFIELNLAQKIRNAKSEIKILQIWLPDVYRYEQALRTTLNNDVKVQFLFLNPHSEQTGRVNEDMNFNYKDEVERSIKNSIFELNKLMERLPKSAKNNLHIGLYDSIPSMSMYFIDSELFFSPYVSGEKSQINPTIQINENQHSLVVKMQEHYNRLWVHSTFVQGNEESFL